MLQRYYLCVMSDNGINTRINWDALGISASLACAIHCALLPLFLTSLPVLGFNIINNLFFETLMIFAAVAIGCYALYHGFKKHHHNTLPLIIFCCGMLLLFGKQIWHQWQLWFLIPAVCMIVSAHYLNYRLCKKAHHCHTTDCNH